MITVNKFEMNAFQAFLKYSQNHTLEEYHERNSRFDYDGASIVFFDSYPTAASIYRNPEIMGPMEVDERNMGTEPGAVVSIAARETLLFGTMP